MSLPLFTRLVTPSSSFLTLLFTYNSLTNLLSCQLIPVFFRICVGALLWYQGNI
jgi:hypothetical protein